jgi:hypothetical protein
MDYIILSKKKKVSARRKDLMQVIGNYTLRGDKVVQYAFGRFQNIIDVRRLV